MLIMYIINAKLLYMCTDVHSSVCTDLLYYVYYIVREHAEPTKLLYKIQTLTNSLMWVTILYNWA